MLVERRKLTTNPLTSTEGVALQVDDVYVPLGLVERKKQSKRQGDISPEQGSELYKETEITKTFEHNVFLDEVLKQKNTPKSQGKRIAIIGEPGAGKTTLLQQIADWVSREIDQSIVIWVSLADLRGQELKSYLFETWLTQVAEKTGKAEATKQLKDDFVTLFNQNNVWLLLDGLDEMSAYNPLTEIARQFREGGLISQVQIVLTCRVNLWDGSINALNDFDTYRTLDFSYPQQVERFIHKWFAAIPETGKQLCTALKEPGKERIQDLVKNPLRLTLLCLNWQSGDGKLPDTQAGLYQQFVDDFYKWKKEEFATNSHQRQQLNIKLGELAKVAIDKEATRFRLRQDFVSQFLGDIDDDNSLLKLALNRGWLNCVGIDTNRKPVYAFFHASFQEYFAAKAIDDWHFFLNHVPSNPSQGTYRIFEPQWKQPFLLWLGRQDLSKEQKQGLIKALVQFKDRCRVPLGLGNNGFYEYRAYFLAAAGLTEFRDYPKADKIIAQIIKWSFGYFTYIQLIEDDAHLALQQTDRTKAIAALERLIQSKKVNHYRRCQVASSLGQIDPGNEIAISTMIRLLQSQDVDNLQCSVVLASLEKIGIGNEKAIAALIQLLQSQEVNSLNHSRAANVLKIIGIGNEKAIAALIQLLQNENTRRNAAEILEEIGIGNEFAIAALVQLLQDENTRDDATEILKKISIGNEKAISALIQLLQDKNTCIYAAEILEKIGIGNEKAITALVKLLRSLYVDKYTRSYAAEILEEIGIGNEIAIAFLVQLLEYKDLDENIRWRAVETLEEIGIGNEIAIAFLVQLLQSQDVHHYIGRKAAESLGRIDPGNPIAIAFLVQLLQSQNVDKYTRREAAESLGRIGIGNEKAIAFLVKLLQSQDVNDYTRQEAAEILVRIDPGNEKAIAFLVKLLQSQDVAQSLEKIGIGNETAISALLNLLQSQNRDIDNYTRKVVLESLEKIGIGNEAVISVLLNLLQSQDVDKHDSWEVLESLEKISIGNETAISALVQLLQSIYVDKDVCSNAAKGLGQILQDNKHRFVVVKTLSGYCEFHNGHYYHLAWKCAQNMPYPDFHQAWHQSNFAIRGMRIFAKILFTRII
ncbi:HEAT repeat domain-containing protein [Nostoc sp. TCL240-02]|uniref:HEAT repeat domain-containing protein n=1 Tax=Nostoc sp. TCL240-02 TaxID=2572090 RepID=UPI00157F811E|nr:HEAT repeat domain-containing protein [Nostoc sp. TCL240-02]QKQ72677.1 NACHT domain-containing protein [Nostoc sp. TCL240-02]